MCLFGPRVVATWGEVENLPLDVFKVITTYIDPGIEAMRNVD